MKITELEDIAQICRNYRIEHIHINQDGTVDVDGDVSLFNRTFSYLPVTFGHVTGNFSCEWGGLSSLMGSPRIVGGDFRVNGNRLESLYGSPVSVGGDFTCSYNSFNSLNGISESIGGLIFCFSNFLFHEYNIEQNFDILYTRMTQGSNVSLNDGVFNRLESYYKVRLRGETIADILNSEI